MVALNNLNPIGYGTYKMTFKEQQHQELLHYAFRSGCNLIDTANSYMDGDSERLIGKTFESFPEMSSQCFIITKAGFVFREILSRVKTLRDSEAILNELSPVRENIYHSMHPSYLRNEILTSLKNLNREYIDCFLMHNPENYFLGKDADEAVFYDRIKRSFEFLESQVALGLIRYYGISSNFFHLSVKEASTPDIRKILAIARSISSNHHFKFIQFPFNLLERNALEKQYDGKSLIDLATENQMITLINRPLSSEDEQGFIRLATYPVEISTAEEQEDDRKFAQLVQLLDQQLQSIGEETPAKEFPIVEELLKNYKNIGNSASVKVLYNNYLMEFMKQLYESNIPQEVSQLHTHLRSRSILYSQRKMSKRADEIKKELIDEGIIAPEDQRPLSIIACSYYLKIGINHVLVGMPRQQYIDELKCLFNKNPNLSTLA